MHRFCVLRTVGRRALGHFNGLRTADQPFSLKQRPSLAGVSIRDVTFMNRMGTISHSLYFSAAMALIIYENLSRALPCFMFSDQAPR